MKKYALLFLFGIFAFLGSSRLSASYLKTVVERDAQFYGVNLRRRRSCAGVCNFDEQRRHERF